MIVMMAWAAAAAEVLCLSKHQLLLDQSQCKQKAVAARTCLQRCSTIPLGLAAAEVAELYGIRESSRQRL